MKSHARVVVIGGGVVGCATLYHLAKLGCTDALLIERSELTSGSTWHAAAGTHVLHDVTNLARMHHYSITLYPKLEAETGQSCGIHAIGGIYLAASAERADQLRILKSKSKYLGFTFDQISIEETLEMFPLLDPAGVQASFWQPDEVHVDPSGVTHAFAKGARQMGAEIERFCPVIETNPRPDGGWDVVTEKGTVVAESVVNAAGLWGREVARLAGIELPLAPMEHQYLVTEPVEAVEALTKEMPLLHDADGEYYLRQEGQGFLFGAYERGGKHWAVEGTPLDFGHELLPDDLDRISENYMRAVERVPSLGEAGVKRVINGPMIWTPDVYALVGPMPGLRNYYAANGMIPGFSQGPGVAKSLAEIIVHGQPEWDISALDVARFGPYAGKGYTMAKAADNYETRFRIHFPNEERDAGRPLRTRPIYLKQKEQGAVHGASYGWEVPLFFAPGGGEVVHSFRRASWFEQVREECLALRAGVGLLDTSHFAKYRVSGPGAEAWLNHVMCNRMPQVDGKTVLTPMANEAGRVIGDFTVTRAGPEEYYLFGSGVAERYHWRWFEPLLPESGVKFESLTAAWAGFNLAGPRSREMLAELVAADTSNEAFPFLTTQWHDMGLARGLVLRISFTGDLGYEIYVPNECQLALYERLLELGKGYDLKLCGGYAMGSLRLEKGYGSWGREYGPEYTPFEAGLDRFVRLQKDDFIGREALLRLKEETPRWKFCAFTVDAEDADAWGGEPVMLDGRAVGQVTSGGYGHHVGQSIALAYLDSADIDPNADYRVEIVGEPRPARMITAPLFDPNGGRMRG